MRSDSRHHAFFKSGTAVVLTAGALWGALLLLRIGGAGSFTSVSIREINAHGHAQIFGWVGLFVLGASYAILPRLFGTALAHPRLAGASGVLLLAGVIVRSIAEPLSAHAPFLVLALTAAAAEIAAAILFAFVIITMMKRRATREPADAYIVAGALFFAVQAVYEAALLGLIGTADSRQELIARIGTFQAPLRDLQIHGFALLMILGMTQRYLVPAYALPRITPRRSLVCLAAIMAAVLGEGGGLIAFRMTGETAFAGVMGVSILVLAAAAAALVLPWRLYDPPRIWDPSLKYVRAGYTWLGISLAMLLLMPAYLKLTGQPFSHAYYGAARHAVTVGFVSLMIMGVAARAVGGASGRWNLGTLRLPFALMNIGCALRVLLQAATDLAPAAFRLVGVSGLIEVSGLAIWSVQLWRAMREHETASARARSESVTMIQQHVSMTGGAN